VDKITPERRTGRFRWLEVGVDAVGAFTDHRAAGVLTKLKVVEFGHVTLYSF
jgi:hypothetical protein